MGVAVDFGFELLSSWDGAPMLLGVDGALLSVAADSASKSVSLGVGVDHLLLTVTVLHSLQSQVVLALIGKRLYAMHDKWENFPGEHFSLCHIVTTVCHLLMLSYDMCRYFEVLLPHLDTDLSFLAISCILTL